MAKSKRHKYDPVRTDEVPEIAKRDSPTNLPCAYCLRTVVRVLRTVFADGENWDWDMATTRERWSGSDGIARHSQALCLAMPDIEGRIRSADSGQAARRWRTQQNGHAEGLPAML
jgi:hypothetical protein